MAKRSISQARVRATINKEIKNQEISELKLTVNILERHIIQYSEECEVLKLQLKNSHENCKSLEEKLQSQSELIMSKNSKITSLTNEINELNLEISKKHQENQQINHDHLSEYLILKKEIARLNEILKMASEEVEESKYFREKMKEKLLHLFNLSKIPKKAISEMTDTDLKLKKLTFFFSKIPKVFEENSKLIEENRHLFAKIQKLPDEDGFKGLLMDSDGLSFFQNKGQCGKPYCASRKHHISSWIPKPVSTAFEEFKSIHNPVIVNAVTSLIYKVNQMWQKREHNRIERVKRKYVRELEQSRHTASSISGSKKSKTYSNFTLSAGKIKEKIAKEYEVVSEKVIKIIKEFLETTERTFNVDQTIEWLSDSLLCVLAEFTNKIYSLI